jgi:hypothetical protein
MVTAKFDSALAQKECGTTKITLNINVSWQD